MTNTPPANNTLINPLLVLAIFIVAIGLLFLGYATVFEDTAAVQLKEGIEWEDYSALLANLFLIALLIERALEIFYVSPQRKPQKQNLKKAVGDAASPRARSDSHDSLQQFRVETRRTCLFAGFGLGILCGLAGIQVLEVVLTTDNLSGKQLSLFRALDVFFTAAILGGGSAGVNNLTARLKDFIKPEE